MIDDASRSDPIRGRVKWFDPNKEFGFIAADEGGPDILLHANVLRAFGRDRIADGSEIWVDVQRTARGLQAVAVLRVEPPDAPVAAGFSDPAHLDLDELADLPVEPARMKWFDKGKGFGFAQVWGRNEDVFVHAAVLSRAGLADIDAGEAVGLRVIDGQRGRMAMEVLAWDAAPRT